jgi:hypothetical protein
VASKTGKAQEPEARKQSEAAAELAPEPKRYAIDRMEATITQVDRRPDGRDVFESFADAKRKLLEDLRAERGKVKGRIDAAFAIRLRDVKGKS